MTKQQPTDSKKETLDQGISTGGKSRADSTVLLKFALHVIPASLQQAADRPNSKDPNAITVRPRGGLQRGQSREDYSALSWIIPVRPVRSLSQ